jgi:hypothetical protein
MKLGKGALNVKSDTMDLLKKAVEFRRELKEISRKFLLQASKEHPFNSNIVDNAVSELKFMLFALNCLSIFKFRVCFAH